MARHIKQLARRPLEFDGEGPPCVQKPASGVDGSSPFLSRNSHGLVALQPCPCVGIGQRDAAKYDSDGRAPRFIGIWRAGNVRANAPDYINCQLIFFEA